jgi:hypothetical protein
METLYYGCVKLMGYWGGFCRFTFFALHRPASASNRLKGLQQPRGWGSLEAVGLAANFIRIGASTACLLAFNNPARRFPEGRAGLKAD